MKIYIFIFFLISILNAKTITSNYSVSYGLWKNLGNSEVYINIDSNNKYIIKITGKSKGIVNILSNGRTEQYESNGVFENGLFKPSKYIKIKETNSGKITEEYYFDNEKKIISKILTTKKETIKTKNEFYAKDDLLSLFFNIREYSENMKNFNNKFYAVGGKEEDGTVIISTLTEKEKEKINKRLKIDSDNFFKIKINDEIFPSKNGELFLNINEDNIVENSVLLDVLFFGDVVSKKIN